jgi:release factor glutamine methyltransferase|tara:strand:- start:192 stop:1034 length:843 start_codon:yes stop_codon:yes gene_type:complete
MNIEKAINEGYLQLKKNKIKSSHLDSEILMSQVIKKDREYLILNLNQKINGKAYKYYHDLINERSKGKPIAYITGKKFFWKHEFYIDQNVLIPRPETELIIEYVLKKYKNKTKLRLLEIGVGSGCVLLSILDEKKNFLGTGIDLTNKCLKICNNNAIKIGIKNRLKLHKSDIDNFNLGKYDLIISNPPYIKKIDLKYLDTDVKDFEPKMALDGGLEGLSEIRKVIRKSSDLIKKKGILILEIAFNQKNDVKKLLNNKGFYINKVLKDYANKDRCIISTKI